MESGAERQSCIWSNSLWGWKCWKTPFFFFMVMENSITNLAWCWQAPYLSLSINLAKTMHPTSVIPQEPVPPKAAPTPPHLAGGPGWNQAPPKWLLLWGPAPHTRISCGPPTTGGHTKVSTEGSPLGHLARVTAGSVPLRSTAHFLHEATLSRPGDIADIHDPQEQS